MPSLFESPIQKIILILAVIASILLQYPHPKLDLVYYSDLAANYVSYDLATGTGNESFTKIDGDNANDKPLPLDGITVVITGPTSGIGHGLTKVLYGMGAKVIAIGRSATKLEQLEKELEDIDAATDTKGKRKKKDKRIVSFIADFSDLNSVANAANQILKSKDCKKIDFLVNNAGIADGGLNHDGSMKTTAQGYELVFGVNYISHFLLTEKLLPLLSKSTLELGPKIIQTSSTSHHLVNQLDLIPSSDDSTSPPKPIASDPKRAQSGFFIAYATSKLAQIYHARALNNQFALNPSSSPSQPKNIRAVSVCPLFVATNIGQESSSSISTTSSSPLFFFDSQGFGLAALLSAMFLPFAGSGEDFDYVTNAPHPILDYDMKWLKAVGLKTPAIMVSSLTFLLGQKVVANTDIRKTSIYSYDEETQKALYDWSKEAVAPFM